MGRISKEQMKYTCQLAALKLTEEEQDTVRKGIDGLLDCFDVLETLDTDGVEPAVYLHSVGNVFREDEIHEMTNPETMLKNAPERKNGAFAVPGKKS